MLLLQLARGALVPHAPLLLPELSSGETRSASAAIRRSIEALNLEGTDVILIASPHGSVTGVYADVRGSLGRFGHPEISVAKQSDPEGAAQLADAWGKPLLGEEVDHGIFVPVSLVASGTPIIAVAFAETTEKSVESADSIELEVAGFIEALSNVAGKGSVMFVASANDSAGLTRRAPLTEIAGAADLRVEFLAAMTDDVGKIEPLARRMWANAGSCGLAPLLCLARLFAGRPADVVAAEQPVGVGYTVAATT